MISRRVRYGCSLVVLTLIAFSSQAPRGTAQKAAPPVQVPNPLAPALAVSGPLGLQRGTTAEIVLTGTNLAEPTGLWTNMPGKLSIPKDKDNGKDNAKLRVQVEIPKDAPLGLYSYRLATTRGLSNFRLFCVDDLPQVLEVDTNHTKATAQTLPVPCVVVGKADAEVSDYFKLHVQAGQRISFDVLGRRLGSAFDPQITLFDAHSGRELPGGYSNDAPGCQTDPRLTYTFREAGECLVEVRDVMYRGGADFFYRLRIGEFPLATTPLPMAAKRGSKVMVNFAGTAVEGVFPVEVTIPASGAEAVQVAPRGGNGLSGWPVSLAVSDLDEVVEQEPNNEPAKANRVPVPGAVTAVFQEKGDIDHFVFAAKKGQRYVIESHTLEYHSPTEVYMVLKDVKGGQVAATNPAAAPRIDFTAPADGDFTLSVEHLHYWGGPAESYRITILPYEPGFDLKLVLDRFDLPPGGGAVAAVQVTRRDYGGPIDLSVTGAPGISGATTLSPGQTTGLLYITAKPDVPLGPHAISVQGKAMIGKKSVVVRADVSSIVSQNLAGLTFPPRHLFHEIGVAVIEKPPFELAAKFDLPEASRGTAASLTVTAKRSDGFTEEIALSPLDLPANVTAALKPIPKGQNEVKVQLTPALNAALGQFPFSLLAKTKFKNRDYIADLEPVSLNVALPFELKAERSPLKFARGTRARLKINAIRKGGYQGPIKLDLRNLPAQVTAAPAEIPMGKDAVEVELTAASTAAAGPKPDVNVLGTATAAGNQQNASPQFILDVLPTVPFELKVEPLALRLEQGDKAKLRVMIDRKSYQGPIALELHNLPPQVEASKAVISTGQPTAEIDVTAALAALVGTKSDLYVLGTAVEADNVQVPSGAITLAVTPGMLFDLKAEPQTIKITQGSKVKVKITVDRKKGYQGPITVELRDLPAKVQAASTVIDQGKTSAEIEVTAAADAAVGDTQKVFVLGLASGAANQPNVTPRFTVSVAKK